MCAIESNTTGEIETLITAIENDPLVQLQPLQNTLNTRKRIVKRAVKVKTQNLIVTRLLTRKTASLPNLVVMEVDQFENEEAESNSQSLFPDSSDLLYITEGRTDNSNISGLADLESIFDFEIERDAYDDDINTSPIIDSNLWMVAWDLAEDLLGNSDGCGNTWPAR
ncbi:hypothetical protein N431DRAFT_458390 [Stipitochalara longipes BDJ]|nr:hypothetical protein N431DRAFT_458390 [Stipitochalara longipes BDJ]